MSVMNLCTLYICELFHDYKRSYTCSLLIISVLNLGKLYKMCANQVRGQRFSRLVVRRHNLTIQLGLPTVGGNM